MYIVHCTHRHPAKQVTNLLIPLSLISVICSRIQPQKLTRKEMQHSIYVQYLTILVTLFEDDRMRIIDFRLKSTEYQKNNKRFVAVRIGSTPLPPRVAKIAMMATSHSSLSLSSLCKSRGTAKKHDILLQRGGVPEAGTRGRPLRLSRLMHQEFSPQSQVLLQTS